MIMWVTGISGAGKTTIGTEIYTIWKNHDINTVLIDGDVIRKILLLEDGASTYTEEARYKIAQHYIKLCQWLEDQNINVVICTIANFEDLRQQNRMSFDKYFEVFVKVSLETAARRDKKDLYRLAFEGKKKDVVGVDIPFSEPEQPDYIFDNSMDDIDHSVIAREILNHAGILEHEE